MNRWLIPTPHGLRFGTAAEATASRIEQDEFADSAAWVDGYRRRLLRPAWLPDGTDPKWFLSDWQRLRKTGMTAIAAVRVLAPQADPETALRTLRNSRRQK